MSAVSSLETLSFPWPVATVPQSRVRGWRAKLHAIQFVADAVAVSAAVAVTFLVLFRPDQTAGNTGLLYLALAPVVAAAWVVALEWNESRSYRVAGTGLEEYRRVITASFGIFGLLAITSYVFQVSLSRALFVTTLPLGLVFLLGGRLVVRQFLNRLRVQNRAMTSALLIGSAANVNSLLADLNRRTDAGYLATGVCLVGNGRVDVGKRRLDRCYLDQVPALAASGRYGAVIISDGLTREEIRDLAWRLENSPVELMFQPRLVDVAGPRMSIREAQGLSLVHVDLPRFTGYRVLVKRAFDLVFSLTALLIAAPLLALIAVLIKLDDGGPVIFRQQRVGRYGRPFTIHKFRTMCVDAEARVDALIEAHGGRALLFKMDDDPRITRIGRILRKYSLDELPQFWSVLRGGMSVVGPRPQVAREVAEYTNAHHRRLLIKPGITGLWQVSGRSDLTLDESIRLDLRYVENWSLAGDLTLIIKTVRVMLRPNGAY
jgi:exopolysaccharide biosynthesis polyprenyl glycosylphosphotransferase